MSRCKGITKKGARCKNTASGNSDYCHFHQDQAVNDGESQHEKRQKDWQANHSLIVGKYIELLKSKKSSPTLQEVADATGFHINTVWRHINEMDLSEHVEVSGTRALTQDVILGVAEAAQAGSSANARLYFEIVHGWAPRQELDHSGLNLGRVFPDDSD